MTWSARYKRNREETKYTYIVCTTADIAVAYLSLWCANPSKLPTSIMHVVAHYCMLFQIVEGRWRGSENRVKIMQLHRHSYIAIAG